jgi:NAD(P)-dependent dehydrogenase (short-subunit alcohol dehydrogenase family)
MDVDLTGRVAIVTGASSGIGAETAEVLAACGARVVIVGRDETRLGQVADRIAAAGGEVTQVIGDVVDDATQEAALDAAGERLDVLALAAGHFANTAFADTTAEELDRLWEVHVRAPFLLAQRALPRLADGSSLLFYSSTVAQVGFAPYAAYTAVKGAVDAMARSLAVELAPRIRVNTIVPGFTRTPMVDDQITAFPALEEMIIGRTPAGVLGGPRGAAGLAAFLASDHGHYVIGTRMVVDGGWTAQGWQNP